MQLFYNENKASSKPLSYEEYNQIQYNQNFL